MNPEELERMKAHVRECLVRAGVNERFLDDESLGDTARFIHQLRLATSDYNLTLIHRAIMWTNGKAVLCMETQSLADPLLTGTDFENLLAST